LGKSNKSFLVYFTQQVKLTIISPGSVSQLSAGGKPADSSPGQALGLSRLILVKDNFSQNRKAYLSACHSPIIVILIAIIFLIAPDLKAQRNNQLSVSHSDHQTVVSYQWSNYGIGLSQLEPDKYGFGVMAKDVDFNLEKWNFSPFFSGEFTISGGLTPEKLSGGVGLRYLDYRIGGWLLTINSSLWTNLSNFVTCSNGNYSVGNLSLSLGLSLSNNHEKTISNWYFLSNSEYYWEKLIRGSYLSDKGGNMDYLIVSGGKKLFPGKMDLQWSQGIYINLDKPYNSLAFTENFTWNGISISAVTKNFWLTKVLVRAQSGEWELGLIGSFNHERSYGLMIGYNSDTYYGLEIMSPGNGSQLNLRLRTEW